MSKNIGYKRVSSYDQNEARQLQGIELDKMFIDKASAKDTNRPELFKLLEYLRDGDTLHVHSMDRLARNLYDLLKIVNELTDRNISIKFYKESLTFTGEADSMSKLLLQVMGAFAEFERSLIKERQREGIELAKHRGTYKGRKKNLTADQIQELKTDIENGESKAKTAKKYGVSRETLYRYLKA